MISFKQRKVLVLAPHTDDAELGMGATLSKMKREGACITVVAFSSADESLPAGFDVGTTRQEFTESMKLYQVDNHRVLDFKVREFPKQRQEILETLIQLRQEIKPEIVFCPSSQDIHQDHHTIHIESLRAFKSSSIISYELPWNCFNLSSNLFVKVSDADFKLKMDSINVYKSQLAKKSIYLKEEFLRGQLQQNGARLGNNELYEIFEVIRLVDKVGE